MYHYDFNEKLFVFKQNYASPQAFTPINLYF